MKIHLYALAAAAVLLGLTAEVKAQIGISFGATGTTNANNFAQFNFSLQNNGNTKLSPTNPIASVSIAGNNIAQYVFGQNTGATGGIISATANVPAGNAAVVVVVNLNNGNQLTGKGTVNFQQAKGGGCEADDPDPDGND